MGKKHFCFFETAETGNRTPNSGVKGSGANHYPRAPALQTKNHGWFDAGLFIQKPSIKTTPAQCLAAATGFNKLILGLCAMQELPSRQATPNQRWPNAGLPSTTLDQRHTKIDSTCRVRRAPHMKISRADPPAKLRPRPKAALLLGHRLGRRPNNKTTSVRCPHPPGNAGNSKQKP